VPAGLLSRICDRMQSSQSRRNNVFAVDPLSTRTTKSALDAECPIKVYPSEHQPLLQSPLRRRRGYPRDRIIGRLQRRPLSRAQFRLRFASAPFRCFRPDQRIPRRPIAPGGPHLIRALREAPSRAPDGPSPEFKARIRMRPWWIQINACGHVPPSVTPPFESRANHFGIWPRLASKWSWTYLLAGGGAS